MVETVHEILPNVVIGLLALSNLFEEVVAGLHKLGEPEVYIIQVALARGGASEVPNQILGNYFSSSCLHTGRQVFSYEVQKFCDFIRPDIGLGILQIIKIPGVPLRVLNTFRQEAYFFFRSLFLC